MPAPSAPLLIVNPAAGNGRALHLEPWLQRGIRAIGSGAHLIETREPGHGRELARQAARDGHDRVVAVGGDGTVQEVVNGVLDAGRSIAVGIVPGGNGNDLARSLGVPSTPEEALGTALGRVTARIDLGRATRGASPNAEVRHFAAAGGAGFDAQVAAAMASHTHRWQRGRIGYALSTLWELQRFRNQTVRLTLDGDADEAPRIIERRVLFVAFANGRYYGGGMLICPSASVTDGTMDLCVVGNISRIEAVRQLPGLYRGAHVHHPAVELTRARSLTIDGDPATLLHLDGEPFGTVPVRIDVVPGAIRIAVPGGSGDDVAAEMG